MSFRKYKVGDKVRLARLMPNSSEEKKQFIGHVFTIESNDLYIERSSNSFVYKFKEVNEPRYSSIKSKSFCSDELEPVLSELGLPDELFEISL